MKRDLWLKSHRVVCNDDIHYFGKVNNEHLEGTCLMYYPKSSDFIAVEHHNNNTFNGLFYTKRKVEGNAFPIIEAGVFNDSKIVGPSLVVIPYHVNDGVYKFDMKFFNSNNKGEQTGPVVTISSEFNKFVINNQENNRLIRFEAGRLILEQVNTNGEIEFVDEIKN